MLKTQQLLAEDEKAQVSPVVETQRRPGPKHIAYGIASSEWPPVLQRVLEKREPLWKVADDYAVSHETIIRMLRAVRKMQADQGVFTGNIVKNWLDLVGEDEAL